MSLVVNLIGQRSQDVIGRLSVSRDRLTSFCCCSRNCHAEHRGTSPSNLQTDTTALVTVRRRYFYSSTQDGIDDFHEHLNRQNADIQFTKEIEENGKIPFLDCLVTRDNDNKLSSTVYRKPTHTDTDYWTSHPTTLLLAKQRPYRP